MATTDRQLLEAVQYVLIEPTVDQGASWTAPWTLAEVLQVANRRQRQFLKETACILTQATIPTTPNNHRHPLPTDWLATLAVAWRRPDGSSFPLDPATELDASWAEASWAYDTVRDPLAYTEVELPTLQLQVLPASYDAGLIDLIYQALGATLTQAGVALTVPDDCVWIVKWGMLADLLDKEGRGADPIRAAYAEQRYRLGVQLVRQILIGGWF